jgi:polyhydroxyalkanoate synthesis regulator protein
MQSVAHFVNWQETTYLHAVWNQLHRELEDVENLLPQARQKRGLLNFGGHVMNFLFGTATSADLRNFHEVVENIRERRATITHSLEHQLTYTKELDENIRQNSKDVSNLARIFKLQVSDLSKLNNTIRQYEGNITHRLDYMTRISQTVRELDFFSLDGTRDKKV